MSYGHGAGMFAVMEGFGDDECRRSSEYSMAIVARIVHTGRVLVLMLCAAGMTAAVLLTAASALAGPRLFGTVEFQMDLKKQQNWLSAMERNRKKPIFFDEK